MRHPKFNRAYRRKKHFEKQKQMRNIVDRRYCPTIGWVETSYFKDNGRSGMKKWIKQYTHRKARRYSDLPGRNAYRKLVDLWRIIY